MARAPQMGTEADDHIRHVVYQTIARTTLVPTAAEVAAEVGLTRKAALESFQRLRGRRLLALAPGSGEIVMAPPFSAVPTPFRVTVERRAYFANCAWDSLGVAAAFQRDADVDASCGCCAEPMSLRVRSGSPVAEPCIVHFAVPAAQWWDDLVYT